MVFFSRMYHLIKRQGNALLDAQPMNSPSIVQTTVLVALVKHAEGRQQNTHKNQTKKAEIGSNI